jgi:putative peptide zinc metalloprotease protein
LRSTEDQLHKLVARQKTLTITAPCDGWVLPPPARAEKAAEHRLPGWSGTPLDAKNAGCLLESQALVCQIGDPAKLEAVLVIDQGDIEFVEPGQRVDLKLDQLPHEEFRGTIAGIAQMRMRHAPPQLSTKAGGELATQTDESGLERPQSASFQARVLLDDEGKLLRLGLRGRAKIHTQGATLAQRLWRYLSHTFRFAA